MTHAKKPCRQMKIHESYGEERKHTNLIRQEKGSLRDEKPPSQGFISESSIERGSGIERLFTWRGKKFLTRKEMTRGKNGGRTTMG